uniref:Uncharacterized protein n=1 Tax=Siphoviridae sp. ctEw721 TaxID=2825400 RepID=A0A8S5TRY2_9CAUD|nr:MAG TPA: hypothetical protein [Siphoviridae sp. ctEw721]
MDNGELYIEKSMRKIYSELLGKLREIKYYTNVQNT